MELSLFERLVLLSILPAESNFLTLKILRRMREALAPTEEEQARFSMRFEGNSIQWPKEFDAEVKGAQVELLMTPKAIEIIVETLSKRDREKKITDNEFSLCEKFLEAT